MLPGRSRITCMIYHLFPGLDLYCADPAQPLTTASEELDDLDDDLCDLLDDLSFWARQHLFLAVTREVYCRTAVSHGFKPRSPIVASLISSQDRPLWYSNVRL